MDDEELIRGARQQAFPETDSIVQLPESIGRYRVDRVLGSGGFGLVYLAHDDELGRPVAIKMPHAKRIAKPEDVQAYLNEARSVANLDHPNIVPVHDVGSTDGFPCYVVSKYVPGTSLAARIHESRLGHTEAADLVATIANALHYAHVRGLVHRDIKPGNIVIDNEGKPFVVDFGLALREQDLGKGSRHAGTPAYMSPEQARGEGHRVDGRSDIFSLGVVFYELLVGRRPFRADTQNDLLEQITAFEPRPPRQHDDQIPKELERICLKALSKRASDRYTTAKDMADDLRHFLDPMAYVPSTAKLVPSADQAFTQTVAVGDTPGATPGSDSQPMKIVPKGLRSFDEHDADFFLELLPGPRDRQGLPDSIRFWKTRIEEFDHEKTFSVGLIYGPSGCGKSSQVRAGLLPRLSPDVVAIYIESTANETESRLLSALRKRCPQLPDHVGLKETLTLLRRGQALPAGKKLLIVLDQFEQWLHAQSNAPVGEPLRDSPSPVNQPLRGANPVEGEPPALAAGNEGTDSSHLITNRPTLARSAHSASDSDWPSASRKAAATDHAARDEHLSELVQALRQCDGQRVQCIVMVRDDFWLAVSRFMLELEVDLVQGHNIALTDLFDPDHARKVLAAFGRAFGRLPERTTETSKQQNDFLKQITQDLSEQGKVICVRLALFAEMMKGKPWTPAALKEVGGTAGIGVTFLEETFSSPSANPQHRLHQKAARAVLAALLPESGTDIKGHMRSYDELLEASGYTNRPKDFADLIRILDSQLRLITPTDRQGNDEGERMKHELPHSDSSFMAHPSSLLYYQLTHDYLVPSLRDWLTRKQKETRRGRAELRLAERSALWTAKPHSRQLPSWWEYLNIRLLTRRSSWTESQRAMMTKAARFHGLRWTVALAVFIAVGIGVQQYVSSLQAYVAARELENDRKRAESLVDAVLTAPADAVPYALQNLAPLREHAMAILQQRLADAAAQPAQRLHAAMALAEFGKVQTEILVSGIKEAAAGEFANIVSALAHAAREESIDRLRKQSADADKAPHDKLPSEKAAQNWRHKARLAIVALHLGELSLAQDMCQLRPDPIQRTLFIDEFPQWHGDIAKMAELAPGLEDSSLRSALCLAVGSIAGDQVPLDAKAAWQPILSHWYQNKPDGATHSAASWALRQWKLKLPTLTASKQPTDNRDWHVNSMGMTLIKIPSGTFTRREDRSSKGQKVALTRSFLLADREVSRGLFQQFMDDPDYPADEKPKDWEGVNVGVSPTNEHPVQEVSWYYAVLFCNWLSQREGLPVCYERTGEKEKIGSNNREYDAWRSIPGAGGFRLPTEAEWEYACRAGTVTEYGHGDDESLLDRYAVYLASRAEICGTKLPNCWGLFDMHGNVWEWCHDWYGRYGDHPVEDPTGPANGSSRLLRGGGWLNFALVCRAACRGSDGPPGRIHNFGFRVCVAARTRRAKQQASWCESGGSRTAGAKDDTAADPSAR